MDHTIPQLPFRISICGRSDIPQFANSNMTHLLSVDGSYGPTPTPQWFTGTHWHIVFDDVVAGYEAWEPKAIPPTHAIIEAVFDHARTCLAAAAQGEVYLLVHCMAGISRSPAVVFCILAMLFGPDRECEVLKSLIAIRPQAAPNRWVIKIADDILKRNGKMVMVFSQ